MIDVGFISDAQEGAAAAEKLRLADCDLIVGFLTTYMTASMLVPVAQRSGAPVLLLNLQPTEAMDHASFDTGAWLAYCGACPLPEMANAFERCGIDFRSVSGYLEDERAWARIERWVKAAGVRAAFRHGRHGLIGHLYPGMMDVITDPTLVSAQLGGHVEILEIDDLRVRVEKVTDAETDAADEGRPRGLRRWTTRWSRTTSAGAPRSRSRWTGWSRTSQLDSLAYYHRGLDGETHERRRRRDDPRRIAAHRTGRAGGGGVRAADLAGDAADGPARRAAVRSPSCRR